MSEYIVLHKRNGFSGQTPQSCDFQDDGGEILINYSKETPSLFIKDVSGDVRTFNDSSYYDENYQKILLSRDFSTFGGKSIFGDGKIANFGFKCGNKTYTIGSSGDIWFKTINNESILGDGNIEISSNGEHTSYAAGTGIEISDDVIGISGEFIEKIKSIEDLNNKIIKLQNRLDNLLGVEGNKLVFNNDEENIVGDELQLTNSEAFVNEMNSELIFEEGKANVDELNNELEINN